MEFRIQDGAAENSVSLRFEGFGLWSLEVPDPAAFVPVWAAFAKSIEKYDWSGNAYGLQSHMLGNNGNGITHEIWVAFANQQAALAFLDGMYASKEFAEYIPKANALSVFIYAFPEDPANWNTSSNAIKREVLYGSKLKYV